MARVALKLVVVCVSVAFIFPALACGGGGSNVTPPPPPPTTTYTLTVNTSNPTSNVAIGISPSDNSGNGNGTSGTLTRTYNSGTTVTLIAPTTSGTNTFDSWQGCTSTNGATCTMNLSANKTITAYYVTPAPTTWNLTPTWSDDFEGVAGAAPDPTKWGYDVGVGTPNGWGNNEEECYTNSTKNSYLDGNGHLVIEALKEPGACSGAKQYTSARLLTKSKFSHAYGRIEARIQLPWGQGIWPAFWMLGTDIDTVSWPACGEMDIMESVTSVGRTKISAALHAPSFDTGNQVDVGGNIDADFHVYGVIWTPNQVQYYVDDPAHPFVTLTPARMGSASVWAFNHPFFLILNVAVGGGWPGPPDGTTFTTPQKMVVDYVRVYDSDTVAR